MRLAPSKRPCRARPAGRRRPRRACATPRALAPRRRWPDPRRARPRHLLLKVVREARPGPRPGHRLDQNAVLRAGDPPRRVLQISTSSGPGPSPSTIAGSATCRSSRISCRRRGSAGHPSSTASPRRRLGRLRCVRIRSRCAPARARSVVSCSCVRAFPLGCCSRRSPTLPDAGTAPDGAVLLYLLCHRAPIWALGRIPPIETTEEPFFE